VSHASGGAETRAGGCALAGMAPAAAILQALKNDKPIRSFHLGVAAAIFVTPSSCRLEADQLLRVVEKANKYRVVGRRGRSQKPASLQSLHAAAHPAGEAALSVLSVLLVL